MTQQTAQQLKEGRWQQLANEKRQKLYVYELENGNRFETFDIRMKFEIVGGSRVSRLIDIVKPKKQ